MLFENPLTPPTGKVVLIKLGEINFINEKGHSNMDANEKDKE